MAAAYKAKTGKRKDVANWLKLSKTKEDMAHLSSITGIPVIELYQTFQGSPEMGGGTWIHPLLANRFAIWLSSEYGFAVETWINEWRTAQPIATQVNLMVQPALDSLEVAKVIRTVTDELSDNPRLAQILIDNAIAPIISARQLPGTAEPPLRGVAEVAVEMGYSVNASNRVKLGSFVKSMSLEFQKEKRLCNGVMMGINCYRDTEELRSAIRSFFE